MNTLDLNGRMAVITGGAQGIGHAVARRMLGSGAAVVLWDINEERLAQARVSLAALGHVAAVVVDVSEVRFGGAGILSQISRAKIGKVFPILSNLWIRLGACIIARFAVPAVFIY